MRDYDVADTLAQINAVRQAFGAPHLYDLPNARTGDAASCLYYRALSAVGCNGVSGSTLTFSSERQASVVAELWGVERTGNTVIAPGQIHRVVNEFDGHGLQHYETSRY
jgi:hypothetical protein